MASHVLWCRFRLRLGLFPLGHRCEVASRAKEVQCIECNKCTKFHCHTFSFLIKGGLPSGKISNILAVKLLGCSIYSICYIFFTLPRSKGDWFQNSLPFGAFLIHNFAIEYWKNRKESLRLILPGAEGRVTGGMDWTEGDMGLTAAWVSVHSVAEKKKPAISGQILPRMRAENSHFETQP